MSFNWTDFLQFATNLLNGYKYLGKVTHESVYRTVINRSYYAIFKQIEDYLVNTKGITLPQRDSKGKRLGSHERVIYYLKNCAIAQKMQLDQLLSRLKSKRLEADYNSKIVITSHDAKLSLSLSNRSLKIFTNCKTSL